jgi:flavin reductase (DIM6/NTAB) family NADH-FMN oxidoreductase RutF
MTASAVTSVSLNPFLVLVAVEVNSRFHRAISSTELWALSVLDGTAQAVADRLATRGRPLVGQLDPVPYRRGDLTGAALPLQAVAWLQCRTHHRVPAGDHTLVIGEVLGVELGSTTTPTLVHQPRPLPGAALS